MKLIAQSLKRKYPWHFIEAQWIGYNTVLVRTFSHYSDKPPSCEAKGPLLHAHKINLLSFETKEELERFRLDTTFDLPDDMKMEPVKSARKKTFAESGRNPSNEHQ
jgi:hypothetical protein